VEARVATPALFATLKLPLVQGRGLESVDKEDARHVVGVSRSFAERFWPGQDPLGKRFRMESGDADAPWLAVVGVSGDVVHQWVLRRNAPPSTATRSQADPQRLPCFGTAIRGARRPVRRALAAVDLTSPRTSCAACPARSASPRSACSTSPASWRCSACWRWCWRWAACTA
jgi:hypothetical protein